MSDLDDIFDLLMEEDLFCFTLKDRPVFVFQLQEPEKGAYAAVDYELNKGYFFDFGPILRGKDENKRAEREYHRKP